jgi:hypothetical protein
MCLFLSVSDRSLYRAARGQHHRCGACAPLIRRKAGGGSRSHAAVSWKENVMKISPPGLGLVFGLCLALFHAAWSGAVALGWAQPILDFIFWAHFITPPYHVEPFAIGRAAILVCFTFGTGFVLGLVIGWLWNRLPARAAR